MPDFRLSNGDTMYFRTIWAALLAALFGAGLGHAATIPPIPLNTYTIDFESEAPGPRSTLAASQTTFLSLTPNNEGVFVGMDAEIVDDGGNNEVRARVNQTTDPFLRVCSTACINAQTLNNGIGGFSFDGLDWRSLGASPATITVYGTHFRTGSLFFDTFTSLGTGYSSFAASNLSGVIVDDLWIEVNASGALGAVDNLRIQNWNVHPLAPAPVPLPAGAVLLLTGLGAFWRLRRAGAT